MTTADVNWWRNKRPPLTRTISDTGKLKTHVLDFLDEWNAEEQQPARDESPAATHSTAPNEAGPNSRHALNGAFGLLLKPVFSLCKRPGRQCQKSGSEPRVRCRQKTMSFTSDKECPLMRRSLSESCVSAVQQVSCLAEFAPTKKVCFSALCTSSSSSSSSTSTNSHRRYEKRCSSASANHPRPILLQKSNCAIPPPCYMDYATFKAWRRGSRLSIDVCTMPLKVKESREKKFERLVKSFLSGCVVQMNQRTMPDM